MLSVFLHGLQLSKIDFRKNVDKWCKPNRKVIACDGTRIGITLSKLNMTPIEAQSDLSATVLTRHKRYGRMFMPYSADVPDHLVREGREHLSYLANKTFDKIMPSDILNTDTVKEKNSRLLLFCPQNTACTDIISLFIDPNQHPVFIKALAVVFKLLSSDAPVSALLPNSYSDDILITCDLIELGSGYEHQIDAMQTRYCPEVAYLFSVALQYGHQQKVVNFIRYLVHFNNNVHRADDDFPAPQPIPCSYNPESGVAYYFTEHGCKVCDLPLYAIDSSRPKADLYDDAPQEETCQKVQTRISSGGFCYSFLWFCPIHGHCLGFYLMPGHEGRKDPFSAMFSYLPEPPDEFFYDFACSLSEYSLNREPDFLKILDSGMISSMVIRISVLKPLGIAEYQN